MAIPQIVKCVDRPSNTIIVDTGVESSHRFAVRKILSPEERSAHQNTKYGPVVGYIANCTYIPKDSQLYLLCHQCYHSVDPYY